MLIASMIVKAPAENAPGIAQALEKIPGLTLYGVHKEENIIVVAEAESAAELEKLSQSIMLEFPEVIGVFPTYLASDESAFPAQ